MFWVNVSNISGVTGLKNIWAVESDENEVKSKDYLFSFPSSEVHVYRQNYFDQICTAYITGTNLLIRV